MGLKATWHDGAWGMGWWVLLSSGNQFHQIRSWGKAGLAGSSVVCTVRVVRSSDGE